MWEKRLSLAELEQFATSIHTHYGDDDDEDDGECDWIFGEYGQEWCLVSVPVRDFIGGGFAYNMRAARVYSHRSSSTAPPVIATPSPSRSGGYILLDGDHRITAALIRGDAEHLTYVPCTREA